MGVRGPAIHHVATNGYLGVVNVIEDRGWGPGTRDEGGIISLERADERGQSRDSEVLFAGGGGKERKFIKGRSRREAKVNGGLRIERVRL